MRREMVLIVGMAFYWPAFACIFIPLSSNESEGSLPLIQSPEIMPLQTILAILLGVAYALFCMHHPLWKNGFRVLRIVSLASAGLLALTFGALSQLKEADRILVEIAKWLFVGSSALQASSLVLAWANAAEYVDKAHYPLCLALSVFLGLIVAMCFQGLGQIVGILPKQSVAALPFVSTAALFALSTKQKAGVHGQVSGNCVAFSIKSFVRDPMAKILAMLLLYDAACVVFRQMSGNEAGEQGTNGISTIGIIVVEILALVMVLFVYHAIQNKRIETYSVLLSIVICIVALYCVSLFGSSAPALCEYLRLM